MVGLFDMSVMPKWASIYFTVYEQKWPRDVGNDFKLLVIDEDIGDIVMDVSDKPRGHRQYVRTRVGDKFLIHL